MKNYNRTPHQNIGKITPPNPLKTWRGKELIDCAYSLAEELRGQKLDTQLRKIFDTLRKLEMDIERLNLTGKEVEEKVVLLKPRLAYTAARTSRLKGLIKVLSDSIDRVHDREDFEKLVEFMEAVLAYYKYLS